MRKFGKRKGADGSHLLSFTAARTWPPWLALGCTHIAPSLTLRATSPSPSPRRIVMLCLQRPSLLRQFEGQHLANLLWGLTRSGFKPLPDFLALLAQVGAECSAGWGGVHSLLLHRGPVRRPQNRTRVCCCHSPTLTAVATSHHASTMPCCPTGGGAAGARLQAAGADEHGLGLHTGTLCCAVLCCANLL